MGKMLLMISILIFVDLVMIVGFSTGGETLSSSIVDIIKNPSQFSLSSFFASNISNVLGSLIAAGGIALTFYALGGRSETIVYASFASIVLFNLLQDYIWIYNKIASVNQTLALFIIVPFIAIFAFVLVDWLKGRD